jgi:DNA-binding NarL/FixJ family response regulator
MWDVDTLCWEKKWKRDVRLFPFMMNLRSIVLDLRLKGMNGREIYDDLVTTLPDDAPASSAVTFWLRQERLPRFSEPDHDLTDDSQADETDQAILSALTIQPFGSVHDIARLTCLSCSTVHSHLARSLGFRVRHLRRIPDVLTHEQKLN